MKNVFVAVSLLIVLVLCSCEKKNEALSGVTCGNNKIDGTDVCDGSDLGGESCETQGFDAGTLKCKLSCTGYDTSGCETLAVCGDNIINGEEICDGNDLSGQTCESLGFDEGTLSCQSSCMGFDTSACETLAVCGDNIINGEEICDGSDLSGQMCESLGFGEGTLNCEANCMAFDTSQCGASETCGDNQVDGSDVCDGSDLGGETCETQGFQEGTLKCQSNCAGFDTSECGASVSCGDENIDSGEVCDGKNLNGRTCEDEGFEEGDLACSADCRTFDTTDCYTPCTPECGDRVCGPDPVCGESCGECTGDWEMCSDGGQCVKTCDLEPINEDKVLDIDLETFNVSGKITLNGSTMPNNTMPSYEENSRAKIIFRNLGNNDSSTVIIDADGEAAFNIKLFKGTYNIIVDPYGEDYQNVLPDLTITLNDRVIIDRDISEDYNIEAESPGIETGHISGQVTLNGFQMPDNTKSDYEERARGSIFFSNVENGKTYYVSVNSSGKATFNQIMMKGTYNVGFNPNYSTYQNVLPDITVSLEKNLKVDGTIIKNFNLETCMISGTISVNGINMPDNSLEDNETEERGKVIFKNTDTNFSTGFSIGSAGKATFNATVFKGVYDIKFAPNDLNSQNAIPALDIGLAKEVSINGTLIKNYNLETTQISGKVTLNGITVPDNTKNGYEDMPRGYVVLEKIDEINDSVCGSIQSKGTGAFSLKVYKGLYNISFSSRDVAYQNVLPKGRVVLEENVAINDVLIRNYNLETSQISGSISLNGNVMPDNTLENNEDKSRGEIVLENKKSGVSQSISVGFSGTASYNIEVFKGTYDITLKPNSDRYQNVLPGVEVLLESNVDIETVLIKSYNLETVVVSGSISLNGLALPDNTKSGQEDKDRGYLVFINKSSNKAYKVAIGSKGSIYSTKVFKGGYDIRFYPGLVSQQDVFPGINANIRKGCYDYSANCGEDRTDISGIWEFVPKSAYWLPIVFYFTQNGDSISGTYETNGKKGNITSGKRIGNYIEFEFNPYYNMSVKGDVVSGCDILGSLSTVETGGSVYDSEYIGTKLE